MADRVRAGIAALSNTRYGSVCANCPGNLQFTLDKGCKALTMESGSREDQVVEREETFSWLEVALLALHAGNNAKPQDSYLFLKLLLKSKEQKQQIKYLDLQLLRDLFFASPGAAFAQRLHEAGKAGGSAE